MKFHEALELAMREGIKTMHREGKDGGFCFTFIHPMGFFRDGRNPELEKNFMVEDFIADDWEAA